MTAALTFEVGCPLCEAALELITAGAPEVRKTTAMMRCTGCGTEIQIAVQMRICSGSDRRYPAAPLIDWIVSRNDIRPDGTTAGPNKNGVDNGTTSFVANRLGINRNTLGYYKRHGINDRQADELATRLNVHPVQIWPQFTESTDHDLVDA